MIETIPSHLLIVEPTDKEKINYFRRFGLRVRDLLKPLLAFDVFGGGAKNAQGEKTWFIGYRAVVEGAMGLKISELLNLPHEERQLLLEAAMIHHATKRRQYEAKARGTTITRERYDEIQQEGGEELIGLGIDSRAVEIGRAVGLRLRSKQ